jgi:methyltransferase (TIGR00027 family)
MPDALIATVSDTAFWIAHYRAVESARDDALFRDPYAARLAGDRVEQIAATMPRRFMTAWAVVIRTCIIDDYIRSALADGTDAVLNLGAGLDTRPYRMDLPSPLLWIEADYPSMIDYKESRLAAERPRCRLERVKIDLADSSARRDLFARADAGGRRLLVLTEGVVPYLTPADVGALADDLHALTHLGHWIVDYFSPAVIRFRQRELKGQMQNAPFRFTPDDWFGFFAVHGWALKEIRYLVEEASRLHRPIRLPLIQRWLLALRTRFGSPEHRTALRRSVGYAVLEHHETPAAPAA